MIVLFTKYGLKMTTWLMNLPFISFSRGQELAKSMSTYCWRERLELRHLRPSLILGECLLVTGYHRCWPQQKAVFKSTSNGRFPLGSGSL